MTSSSGSGNRTPASRCSRIDHASTLAQTARMSKLPDTPAPSTPKDDTHAVAQFEQSLDELEALVQRMEKGDLSLDESLAAYERGVGLYRRCQTALEQAELRVRLLTDPLDPDSAEPFDDAG